MKKETKSDFIIAKEVVATLELHAETTIVAEKLTNFRKYLRDHSKYTEKKFITRVGEAKGDVLITRLK